MRKLILLISLAIGLPLMSMEPGSVRSTAPAVSVIDHVNTADHVQVVNYVTHTLLSKSTWSPAGNTYMAFLTSMPAANPNGRLPALIIYLHGIDHRGNTPTSLSDRSTVTVIVNKGIPALIATTDLPLVTIPGGISPRDDVGFAVIAPQCSLSYSQWPVAYVGEMLDWAEANWAGQYDPTRVYLVGYSLGGGGGIGVINNPIVSKRFTKFYLIAPGYTPTPMDYKGIANRGTRINIYHSKGDSLAKISISDNLVRNINQYHPISPIQFYRLNDLPDTATYTLDHDIIWKRMLRIVSSGSYTITNGDVWKHRTVYEDMLGYTIYRNTRP